MPSTQPYNQDARPHEDGFLARLVRRIAGASTRRPKTVIVLWLVFVVGCVAAGQMTGTKQLTETQSEVGESAHADRVLDRAKLGDPATENVLVRSGDPATSQAVVSQLENKLGSLDRVKAVVGPGDSSALSANGGRTALVQATMRGDPDDAMDHVATIEKTVREVGAANPGVKIDESGDGSFEKAVNTLVSDDLQRAETISLPITLLILVLAFGAVVAAAVPLLLGITSVVAAMGLLGVISQIAPIDDSTSSLVVLIGLAVGVDYSLFYIRREREERRAGRGPRSALDAAAGTVGRAIVVSGLTVMVALAGLAVTGLAVFSAMALATMSVVLIAVIGSLTVLPASLSLLGERVNKGRIPFLARFLERRARKAQEIGAPQGAWAKLAVAVTKRPAVALITTVCVLGAIAVPALDLHTANAGSNDLPADLPAQVSSRAIESAFPGAPDTTKLVVTGSDLGSAESRRQLVALGQRGLNITGGRGDVGVKVAHSGDVALISVPMPNRSPQAETDLVSKLRDELAPNTAGRIPGAEMFVTGEAAGDGDFTARLQSSVPLVIGIVLGLAFLLILGAFRSVRLATAVMGLNLLSVIASYGALVAVFQHSWAENTLNFVSNGTITNWLPLFMFVILFGLSMDYTVLVLERIREARRTGLPVRAAAAEGVGATAGAVTSAAVVMVGVFSIFGTLHLLEMKELGVGLAVAVLIDATIVRGIALPATVALLGERGMPAARKRERGGDRRRSWDDRGMVATHQGQR